MVTTQSRLLFLLVSLAVIGPPSVVAANWPQFRGPQASGVDDSAPAPTTWSVESGENVRWQATIPGLGHASPIIWGDHVYVASAVKPGAKAESKIGLYGAGDSYKENVPHQWRLLCVEKSSGKILWDKLGHEAVPRWERHTKATHCNSTPATDGTHLVALFGSEGLFCFDMQGGKLWQKDLGKLHAGPYDMPSLQWGSAGSPVLYEGKVVVQCDTLSEQFLAVFVVGHLLWGCSNDGIVTCFDVPTGKINYEERIGGGGQGFTASPVGAKGKLYFTGELGDVFVLPAAEKFSVLATNKLGGLCLATPAIVNGTILFRTTENLLAVASRE